MINKKTKPLFSLICIAILVFIISGCSPATPSPHPHMKAPKLPHIEKRDDPLIGKIFSSKDQKELSAGALTPLMLASDVIYLGEKHDNWDHHQIQIQLIEELVAKGKKPTIGIELFSVDQTGYLMAFVFEKSHHGAQSPEKIEKKLRINLGWDQRPDKMWRNYFSILQVAKKHQLTVFGMDIPAGIIRRMTMSGMGQLTGVEEMFIHSTGFDDDIYKKFMLQQFKEGHCGWSNESLMEKLYGTWLARNDAMAKTVQSIRAKDSQEPTVVILGGGHSIYNLAVYDRVAHLIPEVKQLNIGIMEISVQALELKEYFQTSVIEN